MVAERLLAAGIPSELITYKTTGDKNLSESLSNRAMFCLFALLCVLFSVAQTSLRDIPRTFPVFA
jgi:hypothetical protein